eukprot:1000024_1
MVGQNESKRLAWIWLHHALGWNHVHFLNINIDENGQIINRIKHDIHTDTYMQHTEMDTDIEVDNKNNKNDKTIENNKKAENKNNETYLRYLQIYYTAHEELIELVSLYCGYLFGWTPPWICHNSNKLL